MPTTALILCLTMGLLASVGRSALQYYRTGDFGLRLWRSTTTSERIALALLAIGVLGAPLACAAALSGTKTGRLLLNSKATHGLGLTLMAAGGLLTLVAQIHMAESWRIGVDKSESTALVTSGVFRLIRHPIYTGVLTALSGLALAVPNVIALIALAAVLAGLELQVRRVEEPYLKRAHGDRYDAYARVAGRFVPRVQSLRLLVSRKDTISE